MPNHLDEWQVFSKRYGRAREDSAPAWARRHVVTAQPDARGRCVCLGAEARDATQCAQMCTQEDMVCDECRQWCVAVDADGNIHRLAIFRPVGRHRLERQYPGS